MSRGHGKIERYIIETVNRRQELTALIVMAKQYAGERPTPHLRSSFRRAAAKLVDSGEIVGWEIFAPTREYANGEFGSWRWVLCVGPAGMEEVSEKDEEAARLGMALL